MRGTIVGAVLMCTVASAAAEPSLFEAPSKVTTVALPSLPDFPRLKRERACSYYPGIMVKQVNYQDEKGAHRLSLVPAPPAGKPALCQADNAGEVIIRNWYGYYLGKRGAAFFFDADDGLNGMAFAAFSSSGRKILEGKREVRKDDTFRSVRMDGSDLVVRYRRAWLAPCSMYADPAGCWTIVRAETGLPNSAQPNCRNLYEAAMKGETDPKSRAHIADLKSEIDYEAEARVSGEKTTFTTLPGRVTCKLEE